MLQQLTYNSIKSIASQTLKFFYHYLQPDNVERRVPGAEMRIDDVIGAEVAGEGGRHEAPRPLGCLGR